MSALIGQLVKIAWNAGADVDLRGVGYGRQHWEDETTVLSAPLSYYRFLAGLSKSLGAVNILEIGTHWGGSTVALTRGSIQSGQRPHVVTIDITTESDAYLPQTAERHLITKVVGDANTYEVCRHLTDLFSGVDSIDLLFIDADHQTLPTLLNFGLYHSLFLPKVTVIDDVTLSSDMNAFWLVLTDRFPHHSINAAIVEPLIRDQPTSPGFGMVLNPQFAHEVERRMSK